MLGDDTWVLLTNLTYSVTHQLQSNEIDIIAIGPPGVRVIEVKHWSPQWVDVHADLVAAEADRVTNKARKIGTTLRKSAPELGRVDGAILLTRESSGVKRPSRNARARCEALHTERVAGGGGIRVRGAAEPATRRGAGSPTRSEDRRRPRRVATAIRWLCQPGTPEPKDGALPPHLRRAFIPPDRTG